MKLQHLSNLWVKLIGDNERFSSENRTFNAISILSFIVVALIIPVNIYLDLTYVAIAVIAALPILGLIYYYSRFRKQYVFGMTIYSIISYVLIACGYFFNSGSRGASLYFFLLSFLLIVAFSAGSRLVFWMFVHLIVITTLLFLEFNNPSLIPFTYKNRLDQFSDIGISVIIIIIFMYFIVMYLRHNYEKEKKNAEDKASLILRQNEQLQKLNQEKIKILSIISHDLRSPLSSITTVLNLLTNYPLPENQRIKLQSELLDTTRNTSEMLVNLLSWSSEQMHGLQCKLQDINLNILVQKVLQIQKIIADNKNIVIEVKVDDSINVFADRNMLELTIRNLLNNAIKFSHPFGKVVISAGIDHDKHCVILVRDNGIGMNEEQLEALFKMDVHSTYGTNNEKGIGLGLVLCKEFTEKQNGKIWVHSKEKNGSIFYLKIPTEVS